MVVLQKTTSVCLYIYTLPHTPVWPSPDPIKARHFSQNVGFSYAKLLFLLHFSTDTASINSKKGVILW